MFRGLVRGDGFAGGWFPYAPPGGPATTFRPPIAGAAPLEAPPPVAGVPTALSPIESLVPQDFPLTGEAGPVLGPMTMEQTRDYARGVSRARNIPEHLFLGTLEGEGLNALGYSRGPNLPGDFMNGEYMSFGPGQFYYGGGIGNRFTADTGLHASDPNTWRQQGEYMGNVVAEEGWGQWYGSPSTKRGMPREGLENATTAPMVSMSPPNLLFEELSEPAKIQLRYGWAPVAVPSTVSPAVTVADRVPPSAEHGPQALLHQLGYADIEEAARMRPPVRTAPPGPQPPRPQGRSRAPNVGRSVVLDVAPPPGRRRSVVLDVAPPPARPMPMPPMQMSPMPVPPPPMSLMPLPPMPRSPRTIRPRTMGPRSMAPRRAVRYAAARKPRAQVPFVPTELARILDPQHAPAQDNPAQEPFVHRSLKQILGA